MRGRYYLVWSDFSFRVNVYNGGLSYNESIVGVKEKGLSVEC